MGPEGGGENVCLVSKNCVDCRAQSRPYLPTPKALAIAGNLSCEPRFMQLKFMEITMVKPAHLRGKKRGKTKPELGSVEVGGQSVTKLQFIDRMLDHLGLETEPVIAERYQAILGKHGSMADVSLGNAELMDRVKRVARKALKQHLAALDHEWAEVVIDVGVAPGSKVEIDLPQARKRCRFLGKAGLDVAALVQVTPVPLETDPLLFGMATKVRAIVFGADARLRLDRALRKSRGPRPSVTWYPADDGEAIARVLADMFTAPLTGGKLGVDDAHVLTDAWTSRAARLDRGFITLMARSMIPLKKAFVFYGEGKSVMAGAVTTAEVALKKAIKVSKPVIHADGLQHFWFGEVQRLQRWDIAVPLIMLR